MMMETTIRIFGQSEIPVRFSGGYLFCEEYDINYSQMLGVADEAMYQAKRTGKAEFLEYMPKQAGV